MTCESEANWERPWAQPEWVRWTRLMLDSYEHRTGKLLLPRTDALTDSQKLFEAPFVVVSHGTEADPLLNYGNRAAL